MCGVGASRGLLEAGRVLEAGGRRRCLQAELGLAPAFAARGSCGRAGPGRQTAATRAHVSPPVLMARKIKGLRTPWAPVIRASADILLKFDSRFLFSPRRQARPAGRPAPRPPCLSRFMFLISLTCWELFFFGREGECCFRFVGWAGVRGSLCVFFFFVL